MYDHYSRGQGCILGDDMGLGKTVQVSIVIIVNVNFQYEAISGTFDTSCCEC